LLKSKKFLAILAISICIAAIVPLSVFAALTPYKMPDVGKAGTISLEGSTTVDPIIVAAAADYNTHMNATIIPPNDVYPNDSGSGRIAAILKDADVAMSSSKASTTPGTGVFPNTTNQSDPSESSLLTPYDIARDGVVIIVNSSVPSDVTQITLAQLVDIYMGYDTTWSQISGNSADTMAIVPRAREIGSGTRQSLSDQTKNKGDQAIKTITFMSPTDSDSAPTAGTENYVITHSGFARATSNPNMQSIINDPTATGQIGYVGLGFETGTHIRDLKVVDSNGTAWSPIGQNIYANNPANLGSACYPLARFLYLYVPNSTVYPTAPANAGDISAFISWMQTTDGVGQGDAVTAGFLKLVPDQDVKIDNSIDVLDLIAVGNHVGQHGPQIGTDQNGNPIYQPRWTGTDSKVVRADVHADGVIDVLDLIAVGNWVGTSILPAS